MSLIEVVLCLTGIEASSGHLSYFDTAMSLIALVLCLTVELFRLLSFQRIQNYIGFCLKINIPEKNYYIL
jgi:hypothetical protein